MRDPKNGPRRQQCGAHARPSLWYSGMSPVQASLTSHAHSGIMRPIGNYRHSECTEHFSGKRENGSAEARTRPFRWDGGQDRKEDLSKKHLGVPDNLRVHVL